MPGRLFLGRDAGLGLPDRPRWNIAPGQDIGVLTADGARRMRWGLIPVGRVNARGRPVLDTIVNARSETVFDKSAFAGVQRAAVPVDGWYEWTGAGRKKVPWRITRKDGDLIWFAAIWDVWRAPRGTEVAQVATVTCEPNADLRPIHHRMGVLLKAVDVQTWLTASEDAARRLMVPYADKMLKIAKATDVDWTAD